MRLEPPSLIFSLFSYPTNNYLQIDYAYGSGMAITTTMPRAMNSDGHHYHL